MSENELPVVTVDVATWLRGEGSSRSRLHRRDGKKCCLGFAVEQAHGVLLRRGDCAQAPWELGVSLPGLVSGLYSTDSCVSMMLINDSPETTDEQKARLLRPLAKEAGFKFRFKGLRRASQ